MEGEREGEREGFGNHCTKEEKEIKTGKAEAEYSAQPENLNF